MDPFTQEMLDRAKDRSRALGVSGVPVEKVNDYDCPGAETWQQQQLWEETQIVPSAVKAQSHTMSSPNGIASKKILNVIERKQVMDASASNDTINKVMHQFSAVDKENKDVGIEINVISDKDVEVQVEERDNLNETQYSPKKLKANMRDTSRNRLQRLGALYSKPDDLSSPIHRTEGKFSAEDVKTGTGEIKIKQRYGKLAALANSISQWEDDITHHVPKLKVGSETGAPPPKPDLPSRKVYAQKPPTPSKAMVDICKGNIPDAETKTKQLKWDPKVINSLEAQGFQRRESNTAKLSYEYDTEKAFEEPKNAEKSSMSRKVAVTVPIVTPGTTLKTLQDDKIVEKKIVSVTPGLVSGRTAAFERTATANQQAQRLQKDPTELSLKERMQLFERNKGTAPLPKAALAMAPTITKTRDDRAAKKNTIKAACGGALESSKAPVENKVRDKVAALVGAASTISESQIKAEIVKQRQEDMEIIAGRFNKHKHICTQEKTPDNDRSTMATAPDVSVVDTSVSGKTRRGAVRPPPPPPPPPSLSKSPSVLSVKRRSPGGVDEEIKRPKRLNMPATKSSNRLYPVLSDTEIGSSESFSDNGNCTTATPPHSHRSATDVEERKDDCENSDNESCVDSEDDECSDNRQPWTGHRSPSKDKCKSVKHCRFGEVSLNSSDESMTMDDNTDESTHDDDDDDAIMDSDEDDYDDDKNGRRLSKGSKGTTASNSFSFRKASSSRFTDCQTITEEGDKYETTTAKDTSQPVKSEFSVSQEDDNTVTLVHTVSFYRKQQSANSNNSTPVRRILREQQIPRSVLHNRSLTDAGPTKSADRMQAVLGSEEDRCIGEAGDVLSNSDSDAEDPYTVQERIKDLLTEVCKQQQVIGQTSQALNLCAATIEFSGSMESVEGERHLLVATHRRQACLDEVQRLRVEKSLRPANGPKERGRLTVKEITVPLRQDYIRKLAADTISGHHLVCLLKYNEHVLASKTVPTLPGLLSVRFPDVLQLNNVYADFRITLEIYGMTAQREILPHDVKYHIVNKKSGIKTPKKKGGADNRLVMPPVQSPAGPHAVRTPALVQYGFAIFSLREIQRTSWSLTQMLGLSPLEGTVHMKVSCELSVSIEHRGFLTMFEEISGFGAWHRRWCYLNGFMLNYWKYPDDEKKKASMGTIDLYTCISQRVATAPRDICARLNTLLLECQRPALETDQESLVIVPKGRHTNVRHLLSADTREERDEWCAHFNKALTLLRAWGPPSSQ